MQTNRTAGSRQLRLVRNDETTPTPGEIWRAEAEASLRMSGYAAAIAESLPGECQLHDDLIDMAVAYRTLASLRGVRHQA